MDSDPDDPMSMVDSDDPDDPPPLVMDIENVLAKKMTVAVPEPPKKAITEVRCPQMKKIVRFAVYVKLHFRALQNCKIAVVRLVRQLSCICPPGRKA